MRIKRALALSTTLVVAALGTSAVTANAADAGQHQGQHKGQAEHAATRHQQSPTAKAAQGKGKADAARTSHAGSHGTSHAGGNGTSHAGGNGTSHAGGNGTSHAGGNGKGNGGSGDPAGNNGTVKIAPLGDFDGIPNNTPHPGCNFLIEWYGFDEGADIISTVTFAMQAPTSDVGLTVDGPSQVFVGGDPATGAGTDTGLDGRQPYTLSFDGAPQAQQGYHVKLTINTPYSHGADVKHKVFWVSPCEDTSGTAAGDTSSSTEGGDTQVAGEQATSSSSGADTSSSAASDTEVAGEQATAGNQAADRAAAGKGANANLPTQVDAGGTALDWILSPVPLMVIALGAALLAFGIVSRRRRA